jgi:cytidylate kinase
MQAHNKTVSEQEILADILRRDERDSSRSAAPLKAAPDAVVLDTSTLDIDGVMRAAIDIVEARRS